MTAHRAAIFGGLCLLVNLGCNLVTSRHPVGTEPLELEAEAWEGTWFNPDGSIELRVVDAQAGQLEAAWIEAGKNGFEIETIEVHLRRGGDALFASVRDNDEVDEGYLVFLAAKNEDQIVLWSPDGERFKALVVNGQLPGSVGEDGEVVLGELGPEHFSLITSADGGDLYDWREPSVLFRATNR